MRRFENFWVEKEFAKSWLVDCRRSLKKEAEELTSSSTSVAPTAPGGSKAKAQPEERQEVPLDPFGRPMPLAILTGEIDVNDVEFIDEDTAIHELLTAGTHIEDYHELPTYRKALYPGSKGKARASSSIPAVTSSNITVTSSNAASSNVVSSKPPSSTSSKPPSSASQKASVPVIPVAPVAPVVPVPVASVPVVPVAQPAPPNTQHTQSSQHVPSESSNVVPATPPSPASPPPPFKPVTALGVARIMQIAQGFADASGTKWTDKFEVMMRGRTVVSPEEYADFMESQHGGDEVVEDSQPEYDSQDDEVQESQRPMDLDDEEYVDEFPDQSSLTDLSDFEMVEETAPRGRSSTSRTVTTAVPRATAKAGKSTGKTTKVPGGKKANIRHSIQADPEEMMEIESQHQDAPPPTKRRASRATAAPTRAANDGLLAPPVPGRLRSASASSSGGPSRTASRPGSRANSRAPSRASSRLRGAETY